MEQVVLLIGGNIGNRLELIAQAEALLGEEFKVTGKSSIYETEAWGGSSEGNYLNRALVLEVNREAEELLDITQGIEDRLGRTRVKKWGDRTMDIDIIYFGEKIVDTDRLKVPHPFLAERRFVLEPLAEVLPDFIHPIFGKNNIELLRLCKDESKVEKLKP
ncbi:2-amino-4-hydroxy-6-hydroxymethyldihydropteridine diphosphokinase [Echinicola sp. CAU 1574]|uniref:2-amino-4-hydroxy-6-hydroxymethyldihydropteridine pyrophosphokinase n=1 Tax=Echinicola arenosa TaxID=2774144 RepID=A0ABR9AG91_9BACT|nr:2-amino-4-hydroxy-6-hydroxymethyldihydropteridine diphosphokinase [Echinicola arenosa]MBD8487251.1 2-amino-4-hydroxy-6-hydroxymethyldihydropteridine diphosphokinase [Echinicola arenosa]